jgi:MFS family permease
MTDSPVLIGGVTVAVKLPWLLLAAPAGVLLDHTDRRKAMVASNAVRCLSATLVAVLAATRRIDFPVMYLILFVLGCAEVTYNSALIAIVPAVVPDKAQLDRANGWVHGAQNIGNDFLGGPVAGLVAGFVLYVPFALHAAAALVAAVTLALIPGSYRPKDVTRPRDRPVASAWSGMTAGLTWLWRHRLMRSIAIASGVIGATGSAALAVYVLFAREIMGVGPAAYGITLALGGAGMLVGSQVVGPLARRLGRMRVLTIALVGQGIFLAIGAFTASVVLVSVVLFMWGLFGALWNVITLSLRQVLIPDHMLGQVGGAYQLVGVGGANALGIAAGTGLVRIVAAVAGRDIGLRTPFMLAGVASVIAGIVFAARTGECSIEASAHEPPARVEAD